MKKAAVLWTGGKDCCLALYRAREVGLQVVCLATFVPEKGEFQAHPLNAIQKQAKDLGLPLHLLIVSEPFKEGYLAALKTLRDGLAIEVVVTGDIDLVDNFPNWIEECCGPLGLEVFRPLWQQSRLQLLKELLERKIRVEISWINHPSIPQLWKGRCFDEKLVHDLEHLSRVHGIDPCGENGEYHTMVTAF